MKRQIKDTNKKMDSTATPLIKNNVQRIFFHRKVNQWVAKTFNRIYQRPNINDVSCDFERQQESERRKMIGILQRQFRLKFSIQGLLKQLSLEYCQKLIKYVIQKKLHWIFKAEELQQSDTYFPHRDTQITLAYGLKKFFKQIQHGEFLSNVNKQDSHGNHKNANNQPSNTTQKKGLKCNQLRKQSKDFQFQLLLMFSVSLITFFFQQFFPQLSIDDTFKSEIYVIVTHVFLDLEVSPKVFSIMKRKFYVMQTRKNYKSLNASYIHELSLSRKCKNDSRNDLNQISNANIFMENDSSVRIQSKYSKKRINIRLIQNKSLNRINTNPSDIKSLKGFSSTAGFTNFDVEKKKVKKYIMLKPTSSIQNNLITQKSYREGIIGNKFYNCSRFNSFLQNTKKMTTSPMIEDPQSCVSFPTQEQFDFYSTIKTSLHVDCVPSLAKKKFNINQYQKLNEVGKLKQIKQQIKSLDLKGKENHIDTNGLSLAMNAFISTSCGFVKKKRNNKNLEVVPNLLGQNNQKVNEQDTNVGNNQKYVEQKEKGQEYIFKLRKLPFNSTSVKLKPHKFSNYYRFNGEVSSQLSSQLSLGERQNAFLSLQDRGHCQGQSKKVLNRDKAPNQTIDHLRNQNKPFNCQQKIKKSTTQWGHFIQTLKIKLSNQQVITFTEPGEKTDKKRNLIKQVYCKYRQQKSIPYMNTKKQINQIPTMSRKIIQINQKYSQANKQQKTLKVVQKNYTRRQSAFGQLSDKLQLYELGVQMQQNSEKNNLNEGQQHTKYSSLQGQVNAHKDTSISYKSHYKSFQLKKKLQNFQQNCKNRQQKTHYSIFNIKNYKDSFNQTYGKETKKIQQIET